MFKKIADQIIHDLTLAGIGCYIYVEAKTTNSMYIRFEDPRMCSIRISDHQGYGQYKYKYNLRSDIKKSYTKKDDKVLRLYYCFADIEELIESVKKRRDLVATWKINPNWGYKVPKFLVGKTEVPKPKYIESPVPDHVYESNDYWAEINQMTYATT